MGGQGIKQLILLGDQVTLGSWEGVSFVCLFVCLFLRDLVFPEMGECEGFVDRENGMTQRLKNKKVKLFPVEHCIQVCMSKPLLTEVLCLIYDKISLKFSLWALSFVGCSNSVYGQV